MHYHNKFYNLDLIGQDSPRVIGTTAAIITASVLAAGVVGSSMYSASQEAKSQKKALDFQREQVEKAENAVKGAEALASQTAAEKTRKQRASQTQTILTSPLGIADEAITGKSSLLGG
jgi:negative regulator of sigma E activity